MADAGVTPDDSCFRYRIDLHVHTRRFSPCAEGLDPDLLPGSLASKSLHGLVITEHDHLWSPEAITRLNRCVDNGRIYRGVEVSTRNGHFIVIGLNRLPPLTPGLSLGDLIVRLGNNNVVVIWAHPYMHYGNIKEPLVESAMPDGIHAVEVASSVTGGQSSERARLMAGHRGWAMVGGSDAHTIGQVGCAYTLFEELPEDEAALARAVRQRRCRAVHRALPLTSGSGSCC